MQVFLILPLSQHVGPRLDLVISPIRKDQGQVASVGEMASVGESVFPKGQCLSHGSAIKWIRLVILLNFTLSHMAIPY